MQIWNSIQPQSLKFSCSIVLLPIILLYLGCNRQPEACVSASATQVLIGTPLIVEDCSERGFENIIALGNGAKFNNEKRIAYTYYTSGTYSIKVTAFSKKNTKKETAGTQVIISSPPKTDIQGNWTLIKVETREQLEVDPNISIFDLPIDSSRTFSERYEITEDSIFVQHSGEQFYLFQFRNGYQYQEGALLINGTSFPVVQLNSGSMVLKGPYFKGFELLYLER